ncbi:MAG: hypothetical protein GXO82_03840, partial [Chlorobi bacterium]|nr:hypothetical protein [Chlorobiota bacterium]
IPGSWDWLGWTPAGMLMKELSFPLVAAQALAGTTVAVLLLRQALREHTNTREHPS